MPIRPPDPIPMPPARESDAAWRWRIADAASFSSALAAAIGAAWTAVVCRILETTATSRSVLLVASGIFVVYSVDRLRDIARDRSTSPQRTAFVARHRRALWAATGIAALTLGATLWAAPRGVLLLCMGCGLVGLLHRRLKRFAALKTLYVSLIWTAIVVGVPSFEATRTDRAGPLASVLLLTLIANLYASNLRDDEHQLLRAHPAHAIWIARVIAALAVGVALAVACSAADIGSRGYLQGIVWIPVWEGVALVAFRPTERYGHLIVDGALLLGALATLGHLAMLPS